VSQEESDDSPGGGADDDGEFVQLWRCVPFVALSLVC
jgi:hypothetical protein